jgi:hypothetical protein
MLNLRWWQIKPFQAINNIHISSSRKTLTLITIIRQLKLSRIETPSMVKTCSSSLCPLRTSNRCMEPSTVVLSNLECQQTRKVTMPTIEITLRNSSNQIKPLQVQLSICKILRLHLPDLGPKLHPVLQSSRPPPPSSSSRIRLTNNGESLLVMASTLRNSIRTEELLLHRKIKTRSNRGLRLAQVILLTEACR